MEEDSFNQTFLTIETTLPKDSYALMERQIQKENSKAFIIIYKNESIAKLHSFIIEEEEFMEFYILFKNNQFVLPDRLNPALINVIINYFYFREVKELSIKLIFDLLDFAIFLNVNDLLKKIVNFLKYNLTDVKKAIFIRKNIFPFIFIQTSNEECNIKGVFEECEIFLLKNNYVDDYLSFYAQDYFFNANASMNLEEELLKKIEIMNDKKINGLNIIKLLLLFKDNLIKLKTKNEINFDFKVYAEKLIEKFVKLNEMDPQALNELLSKLELNTKDFKIKILNERISHFENEVVNLKQRYIII